MAFTGSTVTGRKVMESSSASNLKKLQLELGGKSAQIVFADADLKNAAKHAAAGIFNNHGQSCNAGSRIFVHESVAKEFIDLFTEQAKAIKVGCPFKEDTFQGPQVSKGQFDKIMNYIKIGQEEGATLHFGGKRVGDKGYFVSPTVFTNCKNTMTIMREEIFGPVVAIGTFSGGIDEAVELANDSDYGLAAGVYTSNHTTAIKASNALLAGSVWVNCYDLFNSSVPCKFCTCVITKTHHMYIPNQIFSNSRWLQAEWFRKGARQICLGKLLFNLPTVCCASSVLTGYVNTQLEYTQVKSVITLVDF